MQKLAVADYPVDDLIARRWSPRSFVPEAVPAEMVRSFLEAARWAPSCFNEQPWRFLVAPRNEGDGFHQMLGCLTERNQSWAKDAGVLVLSVAATTFAANGKPNRHAFHDVGIATAQMILQATSLGLSGHAMAGFDREVTRRVYAIPLDFEPVAVIALGRRGEPDRLPSDFREKEIALRVRRPQPEFVFATDWGTAWNHPL